MRISFSFLFFLSFRLRPPFFPQAGGEGRISQVEGIVNDTARYNDKSHPLPNANGRNYKRGAGCSVIILTFNCSIPRDK